jgi:hypothetical protein
LILAFIFIISLLLLVLGLASWFARSLRWNITSLIWDLLCF